MDFFGELFLALVGIVGTLFSVLAFLFKRWMSNMEDGQAKINEKMDEGFGELREVMARDFLQREQHMQLHSQLQDALARIITRLNGHDALLEQHGERLARLERECRQ